MVLDRPEQGISKIKETAASRRNLDKIRQTMTEIVAPALALPVASHVEPTEVLSDVDIEIPDNTNWRTFALCLQTDPEIFFPKNEDIDSGKAKTICGRCAVDSFCLQLALDNNEEFGIWGGLTSSEIQDIKSRPRRRR